MSDPHAPQSSSNSGVRQRLLELVDGELARLPPHDRKRLVAWQEIRTRAALRQLFSLLLVAAACKVALLLAGIWPTALPAWQHLLALAFLAGARLTYTQTRSLASEGAAATTFIIALIVILADPSPDWATHPAQSLGWLWLLGSLGIPVLARLRSVVVFALLLVAAAALLLALIPASSGERFGMMLYLSISIAGGILLRRLRSDLTLDHRRATEAVAAAANTDALTSLANRRGWREQAPRALEECTEDGRPITLLFIDLDHFKQINDLQGHAAGDNALRRVGALLKDSVVAGVAARLGGEEFVCLLPGLDAQATCDFATSLRESLLQPPGPLTFSAGIAQWMPGESLAELLARGDAAMYRAKQSGRDQLIVG